MTRVCLAAFLASTSVGLAECPTRADLDRGIQTTRSEPFMSNIWVRSDAGISEQRQTERDGEISEVSAAYAHALVVTKRFSDNGTLSLAYGRDLTALDNLALQIPWESGLTLSLDGTQIATGSFTLTRVEDGIQTLGDCAYDVWVVRAEMRLEGFSDTFFDHLYAPDLGLNVASIRLDEAGSPISSVFFDEIVVR